MKMNMKNEVMVRWWMVDGDGDGDGDDGDGDDGDDDSADEMNGVSECERNAIRSKK